MPTLRNLLKTYGQFRVYYEEGEVEDTLIGPDGEEYSLWDLQRMIEVLVPKLPPRMAEAIDLFLVQGMREVDAAIAMGLSPTNPVAMYASEGLSKLVQWTNDDLLWARSPIHV